MFQILVVEDDRELNHTVCTFLNQNGYQATGCMNADDAYDAMYEKMFDIIISDIMMPGVDGFEFAKTVRTNIYLNGLAVSMQEFIKENAMQPQGEDFYEKKMAEYNAQKTDAENILHDLQSKRAARLSRKEMLEELIRTMSREDIVTDTFDGKLWLLLE